MKTIKCILLLIVSLSFNGCFSQNKKEAKSLSIASNSLPNDKDSIKPDIKIKVNKKYDSKGNIIQYDSSYSYSYIAPAGKKMNIANDSVYKQFHSMFDENYLHFLKPEQDRIFNNDSLFKYDFFNADYFQKRFEMNQKIFENIFRQMDSVKTNYLMRKYPNGYQQKKTI